MNFVSEGPGLHGRVCDHQLVDRIGRIGVKNEQTDIGVAATHHNVTVSPQLLEVSRMFLEKSLLISGKIRVPVRTGHDLHGKPGTLRCIVARLSSNNYWTGQAE